MTTLNENEKWLLIKILDEIQMQRGKGDSCEVQFIFSLPDQVLLSELLKKLRAGKPRPLFKIPDHL